MYFLVGKLSIDQNAPISATEFGLRREDTIKSIHTDEKSAERKAKEEVSAHPGQQWAVFSVVKVFETTKPNVITKKFNDQGELVLDESKDKS